MASLDEAPASVASGSVFFIGNATTLVRWGPFTLLTDPNFLHRGQLAYLGYGLASRRRTEPALDIADLPHIDAVVLSHLHGDHWDRVARHKLHRGTPILTTPHAARRLQGLHGFRRAAGHATWESSTMAKHGHTLRLTAMPGRHAPGVAEKLLPPVMGSMLEFADRSGTVEQRLYISGDTLMFDGLAEVARRFPHIDVALLHLGGTRLPGGLMVTMDAEQGTDLLELVDATQAIPVHYDDYGVFASPLSQFRSAVTRRGLANRVTYLQRGQTASLSSEMPSEMLSRPPGEQP